MLLIVHENSCCFSNKLAEFPLFISEGYNYPHVMTRAEQLGVCVPSATKYKQSQKHNLASQHTHTNPQLASTSDRLHSTKQDVNKRKCDDLGYEKIEDVVKMMIIHT